MAERERRTRREQKRVVVRLDQDVAEGLAERAESEGESVQGLLEVYASALARGGPLYASDAISRRVPPPGAYAVWSLPGSLSGRDYPAMELAWLLAMEGRRVCVVSWTAEADARFPYAFGEPDGLRRKVTAAQFIEGNVPTVPYKGFSVLHLSDVEGALVWHSPAQYRALAAVLLKEDNGGFLADVIGSGYDTVLFSATSAPSEGHAAAMGCLSASRASVLVMHQTFPSIIGLVRWFSAEMDRGTTSLVDAWATAVPLLWNYNRRVPVSLEEVRTVVGGQVMAVPASEINGIRLLSDELMVEDGHEVPHREALREVLDRMAGLAEHPGGYAPPGTRGDGE